MKSDPEPQVKAGDDARVAFRKTRAWGRNQAAKLDASGRWYDGVRNRYAGKGRVK